MSEMSVWVPGGLPEPGPRCSSASVRQQRCEPAEEDRRMSTQQPHPHAFGTPLGKSASQRKGREDAHLWSHPWLP